MGKMLRISNDFIFFSKTEDASGREVCDALIYLLDNIFIRFGTKLYRQTTGIPMGTNCAPLVADLFLFCYERDFMRERFHEVSLT